MTALSIVIPVFNERGNIGPLVQEVVQHLRGRVPFDIVCVDDQSDDDTRDVLTALKAEVPELRVLVHQRRSGQSTAIRTGVKHALSPWIATLDGDGQNDPADIPKLLAARDDGDAQTRLYAGWRVDRKDTASKRWASRWANGIRQRLLRDDTPDTGCGIKLFERAAFLDLPYFDHMHRYLPALMQRAGWKTVSVPVSHRPRGSGQSKYTNLGRALVGIKDLMGVSWLIQRSRVTAVSEIGTGRKP
ncbi:MULTISPECIES: glycosyltransferase family 2 protein [unclassified Pseudoxanthomonas]|uniref:glycosyltransferase family 2 protein n=1 Tax=unclassified Pseudoxanthomonas TaxID=2645906 RepID=UPI0008E5E4E5|nr:MULTISPECIES: glycosyltransferase family 2 protein [unclassified Pseudoxanthomonas]PPJ41135.1 glycosyltransferase family 2 protein [Pseudoxanthomonas sp. KAs_5_3]SFV31155.1 dolichol-phosphate mannosyltransferase [Pseudoxanthomonas sp. YR558]